MTGGLPGKTIRFTELTELPWELEGPALAFDAMGKIPRDGARPEGGSGGGG